MFTYKETLITFMLRHYWKMNKLHQNSFPNFHLSLSLLKNVLKYQFKQCARSSIYICLWILFCILSGSLKLLCVKPLHLIADFDLSESFIFPLRQLQPSPWLYQHLFLYYCFIYNFQIELSSHGLCYDILS